MHCGLLGRKLGHSYSPQIHEFLGDYPYPLYEKEPEDLSQFFRTATFTGLNVTIPYKKDVIPYCAELTDKAQKLGAVNTIVRGKDGRLIGHNTDYFGFLSMVNKSGLAVSGKKVLVLGSGGASVTVVAVLQELGAQVVVISRSGADNYNNLHLHADARVIVNTTPVGMYPNTGSSPVDLAQFPALEGVLDLIYNPARTKLIIDAEDLGLVTQNGLWMLVAQAKESAEWFTGRPIPNERIEHIYNRLQRQMENIVLIGMPGSGKSTVGKLLAQMTGREFVDSDASIEKEAGMSIPQIFATMGEDGFRKLETAVLSDLGKRSGLVIATGGGCVTRPENYPLLHQNGRIIWLQRTLADLPRDGRPLSQSTEMETMYRIRKPLYEAFSDYITDNNCQPEITVTNILKAEDLL